LKARLAQKLEEKASAEKEAQEKTAEVSAPAEPAEPAEENANMETSETTPATSSAPAAKPKYSKPKAIVSKVAEVKPEEKKKTGRGRPKGSPNKNKAAKDSEPPKDDNEEEPAKKDEEEDKPFIKPTLMKAPPKSAVTKPARIDGAVA
jgi:hypothetical protein